MVSTPDIFIHNSSMSPVPPMIVINLSSVKSLFLFTEVLYVKNKIVVRLIGAAKSNRKAIREGSMLWSIITNR